jgi:hypothetical protein
MRISAQHPRGPDQLPGADGLCAFAHGPILGGVLEVFRSRDFDFHRDHETVDRDTGKKEFAEELAVELAGEFPRSFPYRSFKDAMWSHGNQRGSNDRPL